MNQIQTKNTTSFKLHEGSNYKVIMTYDREEVIKFEDFKKLAKILFAGSQVFVTVNDIIVQIKDIRILEPTKEKTLPEKKELENERLTKERVERRKLELEKIKNSFDVEFYNAIYGEGNWRPYPAFNKDSKEKVLTEGDRTDCWNAFEKQYPDEAKEINEITK